MATSFVDIVKKEEKAVKELITQIPAELVKTSVQGKVSGFMSTGPGFLRWGTGDSAQNSRFSYKTSLNARPAGCVIRNMQLEKEVDHAAFLAMVNAAITEYGQSYTPQDLEKPIFTSKSDHQLPSLHFDIINDSVMSRVVLRSESGNEILKAPTINELRKKLGSGHWYVSAWGLFDVYVTAASKAYLRYHVLEVQFYPMALKDEVKDLSFLDKSYL